MTSGGENGTSGGGGFRIGPWLTVGLVGVVVAFVNATSDIIEGSGDHWIEPVLWEASSALVIISLAPLVGRAVRRWTPRANNFLVPAAIHFGLTIPFAAVHILVIWIVRETAYWAVGARYGFFDDNGVAITVLYEWRKDVLVYAALAATYWIFQYVEERRQEAAKPLTDDRIEVRDGGAAVFLAPRDLLLVESAGNYITFHTAARNYLVRGTLASWEARLTARGFVRVHRSRLVNRARISAMKPTPAGDVEITLDDGRTVLGSRRYRAAFEAAPTA